MASSPTTEVPPPPGGGLSVLVLARAPVPGRCKTRLEPLLGPRGCARLQAALIAEVAAWAVRAAPGRAWMALDGEGVAPPGVRVFAQARAGFGERMRAAVAAVGGPLLFVGTDLPVLGDAHADAAVSALAGADMAIGPAFDGGWYLLALRERCDAVFSSVPEAVWGGPDACAETVAAAERAGLRVAVLPTEHDLDVPGDAALALADPRTPPAVRAALGDPQLGHASNLT